MPTGTPFNAPIANGRSRVIKIRDGTGRGSGYFVYKLYVLLAGSPCSGTSCMGWAGSATLQYPERLSADGVTLQDAKAKPLERKAALTDDGRRLARKGR